MTAPVEIPRKALFERGASYYPAHDSIMFARVLGCDSIFLLSRLPDSGARFERAAAAGLRCWWWVGPEAWKPDTWRATVLRQRALLSYVGGLGYVADVEEGPEWSGQTTELAALVETLREDSERWSVGFTSFPMWPYWRHVAAGAPRVWGCPQLYGIRNPAPPDELRARGEPWRHAFRGGYVPALAAWGRELPELRAYLDAFRDEHAAAFWHEHVPSGAKLEALRAFEPRGFFLSPAPRAPRREP